jgi:hypothetical protein
MCQPIIAKFQKVHNHKFDYSKVVYRTAKTKVIVVCKEHGDFLITPNNHLSGYGCPKCCGRGFTATEQLENFIKDGHRIHNNPISFSKLISGEEQLAITQVRDKLKTEYAATNGFSLLRIRFDGSILDLLNLHIID